MKLRILMTVLVVLMQAPALFAAQAKVGVQARVVSRLDRVHVPLPAERAAGEPQHQPGPEAERASSPLVVPAVDSAPATLTLIFE